MREPFLHPLREFTPFPFWFWNDTLKESAIAGQIKDFEEKGVNGFVIHPRIGIPADTPYLSDRFLHYVRFAVEEAARRNMRVVLYDEGMYPSGSAHGMVAARHPEYAARALRMEEILFTGQASLKEASPVLEEGERILSVQAVRKNPEGRIIGESILLFSDLSMDPGAAIRAEEGQWYFLFFIECFSRGTIRGIHEGEDDGQPAAPAAADLLNPEAVKEFIRVTHDRYYEVLKDYFGSTVIAMFTDEPDVLGRRHRKGVVPWTEGFLGWWERFGGSEKQLPLLWLDCEGADEVKKQFRKAVNKRLGESYYGQLSRWCEGHGIALTGHPAGSCDIGFLRYFQIPGQDLVYRWVAPEGNRSLEGPDSTMAKCSSDAARHSGKRRNSNECFGCCGPDGSQWALSADDLKWFLDWLFVRGVNLLYPHAFFYSVQGKTRYGERPPDVGPHNIWWPDYKLFSDYIKRMCWLMTDCQNTTPLAILCEEDHLPWRMAGELFRNQIEFNYLEENLILEGLPCENGNLLAAGQAYRLLAAESAKLLTDNLLDCLKPFLEQGGRIIVLKEESDDTAANASADRDNAGDSLRKGMIQISHLRDFIPALDALEKASPKVREGMDTVKTQELPIREILLSPTCESLRVSHIRKKTASGEDFSFFLLVNEGDSPYHGEALLPKMPESSVSMEYWHPWEGICEKAPTEIYNGSVKLPVHLERRESLILAAVPGSAGEPDAVKRASFISGSPETILPLKRLSWKIRRITPSPVIAETGLAVPDAPPQIVNEKILLGDWTMWGGMRHFSGTVLYESSLSWRNGRIDGLTLPSAGLTVLSSKTRRVPGPQIVLDLGEVCEIARLSVNGHFVGVKMWAPYRFNITDFLVEGDNLIQVEVANSLANAMSHFGLRAGLIGPVSLRIHTFGKTADTIER